jgi:fatty-acyl-CoA synthase
MIYGDWIGRWGRAYPGEEALVDAVTSRRITYGEMAADIERLAFFLRTAIAVRRGERVACLSFNRYEIIVLFFALGRLGAVLVPLNFRLASAEFVYAITDAAPRAIFFDRDHLPAVAGFRDQVRLEHYVCFDDDDTLGRPLPAVWDSLPPKPPPPIELMAEDPQLIIYTSGTTGLPKGVILTHGMLTWNAINTHAGWDLRAGDRTILHAAMFYTAGWNVFTLPLFYCRGVNILLQGFDADRVLALIASERVSVFFGVPTMFQMMIDSPHFAAADFSSVRFLVSGGAPLGPDILATFRDRKGLRIWEGYGLTEVGPNNFMANGKPGTIGHPMPHVDVRIATPDGSDAPVGVEGEILLRGPNACAGYWNKPQETEKAFAGGWFRTGDLGRVDADGHYAIVGRLKDLIISGGANIYPAEIERAIETHPAVAGAAVIGVPDPKWGEVGKAVLELKPGAALSLDELRAFLAERLGKFKLPKYMTVVASLPRTPASGKVQKFLLKQRHGGADHA